MSQALSVEQVEFFRDNGYLVLRDVLEPALMEQTRDAWWDAAPPELRRDDPESWVGAFLDSRFTWKYRDRSREPWMVELLYGNPKLQAVAKQLLGPDLETPERIRGIYCVFPDTESAPKPARFHVDAHAFHLGVVGYVDDVPPDGGGFTVWPGSHKQFYHAFKTAYTFNPLEEEREFSDTDTYRNVLQIDPVHTYGTAGDVVLWHHRMGHGAGHNRSRQVRQAVLYDFCRADLDEIQDEPPPADMWRHWPGICGE
ncbi:MAG: phytanoyl-CoA dioxygenase family protein [Caldilineaceae bacterium]|nr:phytanoyl-CoA dioxygenase family protein [Caldilineaceae bacterium]